MATAKERGVPVWYPPVEWLVATRAGAWFFTHVAMRVDRVLMPATGGRVRMSLTMPSGLLVVRGARSGVERRLPLLYVPLDGDRIALVASNGGQPRNPAWFHNLRANPDCRFAARGGERAYRARLVEGEERDELWRRAIRQYSGWITYQERASRREIPVFVLDPA